MFIKIKTLLEKISFAHFFDTPHKKFFWGAICFLFGIFIASVGAGQQFFPFVMGLILFFFAVSFFSRERGFFSISFFLCLVFIGALYYGVYDIRSGRTSIPFEKDVIVQGIICDDIRAKQTTQEVRVCLSNPHKGNILIKTKRFPEFRYGDEVVIRGDVNSIPDDGYGTFLKKENIHALMQYPEITILSSGKGSFVKGILFSIKRSMFSVTNKMLSKDRASFLQGILFGETGDFSSQLKDAMRTSGTTHLVALSGYNITILAFSVIFIFSYFFTPRASAIAATILILCFVLMTGAMPSVVRAGIMGILLLFSKKFGKGRDVKNILLFSALLMTMINPRILLFDVGFQLSFLAFIGIAYVQPIFEKFFGMEEKGLFSWKDSLMSTLSAQLMVVPILISQFGSISIISIPANVVILGFIPFTMGVGFVSLFLSTISDVFRIFPGGILEFLLQCEIGIIHFFGSLGGMLSFKSGTTFLVVYYIIFFLILYGIPRIYRRIVSKYTSQKT